MCRGISTRLKTATGLASPVSTGSGRGPLRAHPFARLDVLHRRMLDRLLPPFGIKDLPEDTTRSLNLACHRLDAWPDVKAGFARLANNFLLAPVANANISLMADLARRNQLRFDAILGSEILSRRR
jgi:2-haloacid dehalogenase